MEDKNEVGSNKVTEPEVQNKVQFQKTEKTSLQEFNKEELIGWVIDRLNLVERHIDTIIINHIQPKEEVFFRNTILNTSILGFGSKVKVLANLEAPKTLISDLKLFLSIRNAFAHSRISSAFKMTIKSSPGERSIVSSIADGSIIYVMEPNGKLKKQDVHEYVTKYLGLYYKIIENLGEFLKSKIADKAETS